MVKLNGSIDLVREARAGDEASLNRLAVYVRQRLGPYLRRSISDSNTGDDLLQEILIAVVVRIGALTHSDRFWPWVFAIARSKISQHFRDRCRMEDLEQEAFARICHCRRFGYGVLETAAGMERCEIVRAEVTGLNDKYRDVVEMRYFRGMSFVEIACVTGCGYQQVRTRFFRAKRRLRIRLAAAGVMTE